MSGGLVLGVSILYLALLFAIAQFVDSRAATGRGFTKNPYIYTLSIAVFCTSWTFYGSVGRAATTGLDFLPIYLGPTLVFVLWSFVWVKIIRICKVNRITSIADFISSRYGKRSSLGGLVTIIAVVGTMPYISLQLKSIATSFGILVGKAGNEPVFETVLQRGWNIDTTLIVAVALAIFAILFGTRHIDASEHHEGLVAAIAFESLVKLFAFLAVGFFVTYGIYGGFVDLFTRAAETDELDRLFTVSQQSGYGQWMTMTLLSMAAIICLPRQFYISAVENADEQHLRKAAWLFPLYLLVINIFVLPIALAGKMAFPDGGADADMFVLTVPVLHNQDGLALFAFIGGLSAATSMVIVAAITLSTMVCNDLVMPILLRIRWLNIQARGNLAGLLLIIRRTSIFLILILGYGYFRIASESYSLVTIGLVSFAAAAQFAPAIIGGIFWKGGSFNGAMVGLSLGFIVWLYTLLLPSFAQSGWLPISFIDQGPFDIELLKPYALFGLEGFDRLSHALFWSMLLNVGGYFGFSLITQQGAIERIQGALFVDVFRHTEGNKKSQIWRGTATIADLQQLLGRFVGWHRVAIAFREYADAKNINLRQGQIADGDMLRYAETMLAGAIGSATARVMIGSVVKGEIVSLDQVYSILDETSQVIEYSHQLEQKSTELEQATKQLQEANERLKEFDALKDDFLSMVSHELRTPLTSVRAFSEILTDNPDVSIADRHQFLGIITRESERLTRLIDQLLDLAKMESGRMRWTVENVDPVHAISEALATMEGLIKENNVALTVDLPTELPLIRADRDQLLQLVINLVSNAIKFCDRTAGTIHVTAKTSGDALQVSVSDNGVGVREESMSHIFDKFHQSEAADEKAPRGTGLGLAICQQIVVFLGGQIWVDNVQGSGARFSFTVPNMAVDDDEFMSRAS